MKYSNVLSICTTETEYCTTAYIEPQTLGYVYFHWSTFVSVLSPNEQNQVLLLPLVVVLSTFLAGLLLLLSLPSTTGLSMTTSQLLLMLPPLHTFYIHATIHLLPLRHLSLDAYQILSHVLRVAHPLSLLCTSAFKGIPWLTDSSSLLKNWTHPALMFQLWPDQLHHCIL